MFTLTVVPHAGTWIEIVPKVDTKNVKSVVPHAGTWIEITGSTKGNCYALRRSPRGNVD